MEFMRLDHTSIFDLAVLILSISSAGYLLSIKNKSINARYLAWVFIGCVMFSSSNFIGKFSIWWLQDLWIGILASVLFRIGASITVIFLLKFAYNFPIFINKLQREYKIILMTSKTVYISFFVLWSIDIYTYLTLYANGKEIPFIKIYTVLFSVIPYEIFYASSAVFSLWIVILFFRKVVMFSAQSNTKSWYAILKPEGRSAKAARSFGFVLILVVVYGASLVITPPYNPLFIYISYIYLQ